MAHHSVNESNESRLAENPPTTWDKDSYTPSYGDLTRLNTRRTLLDAVGKALLASIAAESVDLLNTSAAIYEKNGDYAAGRFSSGWCRLLDSASRALCRTADNREALRCGQWRCHENCWNDSAKQALLTGAPTDTQCAGGLHVYAEPIMAGDEIVGVIAIGRGDPPTAIDALARIARAFQIDLETLEKTAAAHSNRPAFLVDLAQKRVHLNARLIGKIVESARLRSDQNQRITERKEAERGYRYLFETINEGIIHADARGVLVKANKCAATLCGYASPQDMAGMRMRDLYMDPRKREAALRKLKAGGGEFHNFEFDLRRKDGTPVPVLCNIRSLKDGRGETTGVLGAFRDISDLKAARAALTESERKYKGLYNNSPFLMMEVDADTYEILTCNTAMAARFGCTPEKILGRKLTALLPEEVLKTREAWGLKVLEKNEPQTFTDEREGRYFHNILLPGNDPKRRSVQTITTDITERKKAENALRETLNEKKVLLREIHHRVKNNMQMIISLLRMHSRKTTDLHLKPIFDNCRGRIEAMSLIHETLYLSEELAYIDFKTYLQKLCRKLGRVHSVQGGGVRFSADHCHFKLDMDQAVAVGMVIAELVSNAFKHAFPSDQTGNVTVQMTQLDAETVELAVIDDGKGLPPDLDLQNPSTLGLKLAWGAVTRELGGDMHAESNNGANFIIRFKCTFNHKRRT